MSGYNNQQPKGHHITRQSSSISLSQRFQGMGGLCKVTLTECLGVSGENTIDVTLISCLFFNWLSATQPWVAGEKWSVHFRLCFEAKGGRSGRHQWQTGDAISSQLFPSVKGLFNESRTSGSLRFSTILLCVFRFDMEKRDMKRETKKGGQTVWLC